LEKVVILTTFHSESLSVYHNASCTLLQSALQFSIFVVVVVNVKQNPPEHRHIRYSELKNKIYQNKCIDQDRLLHHYFASHLYFNKLESIWKTDVSLNCKCLLRNMPYSSDSLTSCILVLFSVNCFCYPQFLYNSKWYFYWILDIISNMYMVLKVPATMQCYLW